MTIMLKILSVIGIVALMVCFRRVEDKLVENYDMEVRPFTWAMFVVRVYFIWFWVDAMMK